MWVWRVICSGWLQHCRPGASVWCLQCVMYQLLALHSAVATPGSLSILAGSVSSQLSPAKLGHTWSTLWSLAWTAEETSSLMFLHNRMIMRFTMQHSHSHTISESQHCCSHLSSHQRSPSRLIKITQSCPALRFDIWLFMSTLIKSQNYFRKLWNIFSKVPNTWHLCFKSHNTHAAGSGIHCRLELTLEQSNEKSDKMQTEYTIAQHTPSPLSSSW